VLEKVRSLVAALEAVVRELDPSSFDGSGATRAVELFAQVEHLGAAGKALAAKRVDETGAYRASGERSAADWLAARTGTNVGAAMRSLQTVEALDALPATSDAFRAGALSAAQAHEITGAAAKDPSAETQLLAVAKRAKLKGLKDRCREVRAGSEADDEAWAKRLRDARSLRMWMEPVGAPAGMWRMAPDKGAAVKVAIEAETDRIFKESSRAGIRESRDAYAADALYLLITRGPTKPTSANLVVSEDRCEITGIGPIPRTIAAEMLADAKVRAIPPDIEDLPPYSTTSRYAPKWLTDWLDAKYPVCGTKGCDADLGLQYDHVVALEDGGRTEAKNLWRLCPRHHRLKTRRLWTVTGTTRDWDLQPAGQLLVAAPP
jgi:hypothetical protein